MVVTAPRIEVSLYPRYGHRPAARRPETVIGPPPDALKPDFQCVRTPWNRGFMTLQLAPPADGSGQWCP
jgi:hypothetical protein